MKKISKIMSLFVFVVLMGGCLNLNYKTTIKDDKSMTLEIVYGINTELLKQMSESEEKECLTYGENSECIEYKNDEVKEKTCISFAEDGTTCIRFDTDVCLEQDETDQCLRYGEEENDDNSLDMNEDFSISMEDLPKGLIENGFVVTEYKENNIEGVKITKKYNNIDDYSKETEKTVILSDLLQKDNFDDSQMFTITKGLLDNKYKANYIIDLSSTEDTQEVDMSQYASMFVMNYSVTLPNGNISNNATQEVNDGKTLVWTLQYGKENIINYEFDFGSNTTAFIVTIICAIVILAVTIIFIIYKINKNRKEKALLNINEKAEEVIKTPNKEESITNLEEIIIEDLSNKEVKAKEPKPVTPTPSVQTNLEPVSLNSGLETINIETNNHTLSEKELVNEKK